MAEPNFLVRIEIVHLYPDGVPADLTRVEGMMSRFSGKLDALEQAINQWNDREVAEDAEHALSEAEVARLTKELADLQAKYDTDALTPEEEARFDALKAKVDASNAIPSEVLPEEGGADPVNIVGWLISLLILAESY